MGAHLCLENQTKAIATIVISHNELVVCKKMIPPSGYILLKDFLEACSVWSANAVMTLDHVDYGVGQYEFLIPECELIVRHTLHDGVDLVFMENSNHGLADSIICNNSTRGVLALQLMQSTSCYKAKKIVPAGQVYQHKLMEPMWLTVVIDGITLPPIKLESGVESMKIIHHFNRYCVQV